METMKKILKETGFIVEDKRVIIPEDKENNVQEYLDKAVALAEEVENKDVVQTSNSEDEITLVTEAEAKSTVEYFEKVIRDANGEDIVVRLSIVKQNSEDTDYERLVNVSYFSKVNGNLTGKEIIGYENGDQFDKDVLPSIIDGFQKNVSLSGKQVQFSATDSTKCYLSNGEDDIYLDGYNVDGVRSLLDYNRTYGLVGDENDEIDFKSLYEDDLVEEMQDGMSFEGEVTDTKDEEEVNEESYSESLEGPRMVKKLGEMPTNNHGLTNSIGLVFYLAIDMIAIGVGLYLLMH